MSSISVGVQGHAENVNRSIFLCLFACIVNIFCIAIDSTIFVAVLGVFCNPVLSSYWWFLSKCHSSILASEIPSIFFSHNGTINLQSVYDIILSNISTHNRIIPL